MMRGPTRGAATLHEAFAHVAASAAGRHALSEGDGWLTFAAMQAQVDALACGLRALGLAAGEPVALLLPGGARAMVAFFAVLRAGGIAALLDPSLRERELAGLLDDLRPSVVLAANRVPGSDLVGSLSSLRGAAPGVREVVLLERPAPPWAHALEDVLAAGAQSGETAAPDTRPDRVAAIIYTTGTTGAPKGVMHTHAGLLASYRALQRLYDSFLGGAEVRTAARAAATIWRYRRRMLRGLGQRTWMTPLPPHSIAGFRVLLQALLSGQRTLAMERFHPRRALQLIARERVSILAATPAMVDAMLAVGDFDRYDLSSLLVVGLGSAPTSPDLARRARERFGCPVAIGYGTTETGGGVLVTRIHDSGRRQAETVGLPFPGAEVRIVDQARLEVPPGTEGELACRVSGLMAGYRGSVGGASAVVDADGWYYTGDLAVRDRDGYVRIVGRKRDLIIRGGQKIVPLEVERVLEEHPGVARAAVVGVPDRVVGERVMAFVVPPSNGAADHAELRAHCAQRLAAFKQPDHIRTVSELPLAASGEVRKAALRTMALDESRETREDGR